MVNDKAVKMRKDEEENSRMGAKDHSSENDSKTNSFDVLKKISVEPCIALFGFGVTLFGVQASTLYITKTCRVGSYFFGNQTFSIEVISAKLSIILIFHTFRPVIICSMDPLRRSNRLYKLLLQKLRLCLKF